MKNYLKFALLLAIFILARLPLLGAKNQKIQGQFLCKLLVTKDRTSQKRL